MIYAVVRAESRDELRGELLTTQDAKWYRRLKLIELSSSGIPAPNLAEMFDLCPATVRDYIHRYNRSGLDELRRASSPGAPEKIPLTKAQWEDLLHQSPYQFERLKTAARNWTQELLVTYLQQYHGRNVTQSAICKHLKRIGLRLNRGKLKVTSPDPLYTVKRQRVEELKKKSNWHLEL